MTLILNLVEKVGYIIAFYLLFKSVPADKMKEILDAAAAEAKKTDYPWDDIAVKFGQMITDALKKAQEPLPKPGETIVKSTSTSLFNSTDEPAAEEVINPLAPNPSAG